MKIFNKPTQKTRRQSLRNDMPDPERLLWLQLKGRQMDGWKFRRQHGIGSFIVDFFCPEIGLVIELDGDSHYEEGAQSADHRRDEFITSLNLTVLRFTNHEIGTNLEGVVEKIQEVLAKHTNPSRPPLGKGRRTQGNT